ncbi:hypothetical protein [Actinoallomurus oryzae]|uniref:hypothetical protein n=1 Tax=Actinoallomurus oryzae TaxID=502180 RepID=UPI0031E73BC1
MARLPPGGSGSGSAASVGAGIGHASVVTALYRAAAAYEAQLGGFPHAPLL